MRYSSTRSLDGLTHSFGDVVRMGLSPEGGLFLPEHFVCVRDKVESWINLSFVDLAYEIISLYTGEDIKAAQLKELLQKSFSRFRSAEITPLVPVGRGWVLELFHGPTYSFKDVALQTLGNLLEHLPATGPRTFLGATSGDTGSAAISGVQGKNNCQIFILFPEGRVSPVQEQQMTTVSASNVHCLSLLGSFDDCQDIVKELFSDPDFKKQLGLTAVNSINWARVLAQVVYYFHGYFSWLKQSGHSFGQKLPVSVPTGNFGDIFAGFVAREMGLPLGKLIIASNENDILTRFHQTGSYKMTGVKATTSPSMDIQISSNFERLLFLLLGKDPKALSGLMTELRQKGEFKVSDSVLAQFRKDFSAVKVDEKTCQETIRDTYEKTNYILDPHTAIGYKAALEAVPEGEFMSLSTASPAKFLDAVEKALNKAQTLPKELADLGKLPVRKTILPASAQAVREFMLSHLKE